MSLRSKIVLGLLSVVLLYAGLDTSLHRMLSGRIFGRWEREEAQESLERARAAYDAEGEHLRVAARTWAARPDVWEQLHTEESILPQGALEESAVDVLYVCDARGFVRWARAMDPRTGEPIKLSRDLPGEQLDRGHPLLNIATDSHDRLGLMMTELLPMVVASSPIPDSSGGFFEAADPDRRIQFRDVKNGVVILGRFLDDSFTQRIRELAGVELSIQEAVMDSTTMMDAQEREIVAGLTAGEISSGSRIGDDDRLHLYSTITDMRSLRPLLFEATLDRRISRYGDKVVNYAMLSSVVSVLLFVFVLILLLQHIVLKPLSTLTNKAVEISKTDDSTIRVNLERADEIGTLATEFDSMLDKLAHSRAQLVKTARLAGMSEIATGVLHNVGNVLNSVNVSANLLNRGLDKLSTADLERVVGVLQEKGDDLAQFISQDPRGRHTLPFLSEITVSMARQREDVKREVRAVLEGIEHISDLVRSQQTFAGAKGVFELANLSDEVDAALRICIQADGSLAGMEVRREYAALPSVKVDKHKLMEVLVNLIQNASQAMRDSGERCLTLRIFECSPRSARIEVEDTGTGILPENLNRVFQHGFTTKEKGHGFGLHTSANAATEMNASLGARSEGAGTGATFFLDIPMPSKKLVSAA